MNVRQEHPFRRFAVLQTTDDDCGGLPGKAELLTDIDGASSRPVRRIVLISDPMLRPAEYRRR